MKNSILFAFLVLFCSCGKHITVNYSYDENNQASLRIQPSQMIEICYMTINGQMVVDGKNVTAITINRLPPGDNTYHITSNAPFRKPMDVEKTVKLANGQQKTEIVATPGYTGAYYAITYGSFAVSMATLITSLIIIGTN